MRKKKEIFRKGNPFKITDLEGAVVKGLTSKRPMSRPGEKFYASDAAHCPRRAVKFLNNDMWDTITAASTLYMTLGSTIHETVSRALDKMKRLIWAEYYVPHMGDRYPDIRGYVDDIYIDSDKKLRGLEVKSCGKLPAKPKVDHEAQAVTYAAITGLPFDILYISRNVADYTGKVIIKSFEVDTSIKNMNNIMRRICVAFLANRAKRLPPIPRWLSEGDCKWCPFQNECWKGEKEVFDTLSAVELVNIVEKAGDMAKYLVSGRDLRRDAITMHIKALRKMIKDGNRSVKQKRLFPPYSL